MVKQSDSRESNDAPFMAGAEVRLGNGVVVEGEAKDISLQGLCSHLNGGFRGQVRPHCTHTRMRSAELPD